MESTQESHPILICQNCRLMYAFPQLSPEELDSFYDDTFANDPGCQLRAGSDFPQDKDRTKEEVLAENWGLPIITRFINPRGKKILDLRCRTGALTSLLQKAGAEVIGVEPFQGNANYARKIRKLSDIVDLPFSQFHQFPLPQDNYFDIVNILPHHVLAHVLSPHRLLKQIYTALKPGGYVFLDEKDVLHPVRHKKPLALDSGPAHQFHLTLETTAHYFTLTGFHLLDYKLDNHRSSDFRHIRIVAQKPNSGSRKSEVAAQWNRGNNCNVKNIQRRLWFLEKTWKVRLAKVKIKQKSQQKLKKLGFSFLN